MSSSTFSRSLRHVHPQAAQPRLVGTADGDLLDAEHAERPGLLLRHRARLTGTS
jgi:hypothetical protein